MSTMPDTPDVNEIRAELLQENDVIRVLLEQHQRIMTLFTGVRAATGEARIDALRELRAVLVVHETSEQMIVRPRTAELVGPGFVDALTAAETELANEITQLEKIPPEHGQFEENLSTIESSVLNHFYVEETEEFPAFLEQCPIEDRLAMGTRLLSAAKILPTRPHPVVDSGGKAATAIASPITSLIDRVRDAIQRES
jgi:hypothetical protein